MREIIKILIKYFTPWLFGALSLYALLSDSFQVAVIMMFLVFVSVWILNEAWPEIFPTHGD